MEPVLPFSVVIFEDNSVEAVPSTWVTNDNCFWPKFTGPNAVRKLKLLKQKSDSFPGTNWTCHKCRVRSRHGGFQSAEAAASSAIDNPSEVEIAVKAGRKKGSGSKPRRVAARKGSAASESSDDSDTFEDFLRQPNQIPSTSFRFDGAVLQIGSNLSGPIYEEAVNTDGENVTVINSSAELDLLTGSVAASLASGATSVETPSHLLGLLDPNPIDPSSAVGDININELGNGNQQLLNPTPTPRSNLFPPSGVASGTEENERLPMTAFQKLVLKKLAVLEHNQKQILGILVARSDLRDDTENLELDFTQIPTHPASTAREVEDLNTFAKDEAQQNLLVSYLKAIGGKKTAEVVRNILVRLFEDGLARSITYTKKGNNIVYESHKELNIAIIRSVKSNKSSRHATDSEIREHIMDWFRLANSRYKRKN